MDEIVKRVARAIYAKERIKEYVGPKRLFRPRKPEDWRYIPWEELDPGYIEHLAATATAAIEEYEKAKAETHR